VKIECPHTKRKGLSSSVTRPGFPCPLLRHESKKKVYIRLSVIVEKTHYFFVGDRQVKFLCSLPYFHDPAISISTEKY